MIGVGIAGAVVGAFLVGGITAATAATSSSSKNTPQTTGSWLYPGIKCKQIKNDPGLYCVPANGVSIPTVVPTTVKPIPQPSAQPFTLTASPKPTQPPQPTLAPTRSSNVTSPLN